MSTSGENDKSRNGDAAASYVQAKNWLVDYIAEHKLGPGSKLPSERILAEEIGFSRPTIARAVMELVREGVLSRAERVGTYVGGYTSRRIGTRIGTIGIVMPFLSHDPSSPEAADVDTDRLPVPYRRDGMSLEVMQGAMSVLKEAGFRLVIHSNRQPFEELELLHNLPREGLDGAIIMPSAYSDSGPAALSPTPTGPQPIYGNVLYSNIVEKGLPVVLVDRYFSDCPLDRVVTDNVNGAKQAVEYLIQQGHRRIAHFTDFADMTSTKDREEGYALALVEAGIRFDEELVCGPQLTHNKQWSFQYALEHCVKLPDPITAVFCLNDDVTLLTLREARVLGLDIPHDFALAGFFDDSIPAGMEVPFTRVIQNKIEMGRIAAKLLLERVAGANPREPRHVLLPTELKPGA